jgi:predicted SAM-dependent methyltransferase
MGFLRRRSGDQDDRSEDLPQRLHVGCGEQILQGWCNLDIQPLAGVDLVVDVTAGFDFRDVELIFCEHFIEHLHLDDGIRFLHDCHRALRPGGVLRVSTPNLDWVVLTHYRPTAAEEERKIEDALMLNRAFHGWGHRFLYNAEILGHVLRGLGFSEVARCGYGESPNPSLRGLERHPRCEFTAELPDVIIFEAVRGPGQSSRRALRKLLDHADEAYLQYLPWRQGS